jgi:pyridoxine 5-phosphate synthase
MIRLGINVDHVATVREARKINEPDPVEAAILAEHAGADQITIHLREDRRHIQDRDVDVMRKVVKTMLNLEMAATQEMLKNALHYKPDTVTLVPERRKELTTEGGLEVNLNQEAFSKFIRMLKDAEIGVSLFIDPDLDQVKSAHRVGADAIELHTGRFCDARGHSEKKSELDRIYNACKLGSKLGLTLVAGHGLNLHNIGPIASIPEIEEVNIGHSIVGRAIMVGFKEAVREMREALDHWRRKIK